MAYGFDDFSKAVRENISDECDVSIEHAIIHFETAKEALGHDDIDQAKHDLNLAGCILLALSWDI